MNNNQIEWLGNVAAEAAKAEHVHPDMAACEAALESGFGSSALAREGNNLFGMKQHMHPIFGTVILPTREFLNDQWVEVNCKWVKYETMEECFADRMETLYRLRDAYPHYGLALAATDPIVYINEVSQSWSTDPARSAKVQAIYHEFLAQRIAPDLSAGDL
jgi:flagellum-specific peptidoglycan hydrolase FlgJ